MFQGYQMTFIVVRVLLIMYLGCSMSCFYQRRKHRSSWFLPPLWPAGEHPQHALVQWRRRHGEPVPQRPVPPAGNLSSTKKNKQKNMWCRSPPAGGAETHPADFDPHPPGLLGLSDPADDGQLCGPVWVQRWGVQRTRRKYQVSRNEKKKKLSNQLRTPSVWFRFPAFPAVMANLEKSQDLLLDFFQTWKSHGIL